MGYDVDSYQPEESENTSESGKSPISTCEIVVRDNWD